MSNEGLSTEKKGGNNIYLKIMNGKLVQTVNAETPNAVARVNKEGHQVHELHYTGVTATIRNIAIVDGKYGKELEVKMQTSNGQNFVIQTAASGGYAYGFMSRMSNLNFDLPTELRPYAIEDKAKGKTNHTIVLYQGGVKIESAHTKENPNGLPELVTLKDAAGKDILKNGKAIWDDSARIEFFSDVIYGEGGINEVLIAKYGSPEQKEAAESKEDFLSDTDAPQNFDEENLSAQFEKEADEQKAAAELNDATAVAATEADLVQQGMVNASKKAAAKKAIAKNTAKK